MPRPSSRRRYSADRLGDHARRRKRRRRPWITLATLLVAIGVVGVGGYVFAKQALSVRDDLTAAKEQLKSITGYVKSGNTAELDAVAGRALARTTHAEATVHGPMWKVAAHIPLVGQNISAVQSATEATGILVRDAVPVGVKMLSAVDLKNIKVEGGGFNLAPFSEVQKDLPTISDAFSHAQQKISGIDRASLLPVVDKSIGQLLTVIDQATPALKTVQDVLPTVLDVAGAQGPRTYLVIFQNNAEIRATGGNPAASSIMQVDNGHVKLLDQSSSASFGNVRGTADLPKDTLALYESDTPMYLQNFTRTPNFPTTAKMFDGMWASATKDKTHLDGVISIDPVALSYMLSVTGPVKAADGTSIRSDNAVKELLQNSYVRYNGNAKGSDLFFADVASKVFRKLTDGGWDPMKMLAQLQRSAKEQRIYMWFPRAAEQALATKLGVDGALAADSKKKTEVGIFLNDSSHSKLEYYLTSKIAVTCSSDARTVTTSIALTSTAPVKGLTPYQVGQRNNRMALPGSTMLLDVLYFAPAGSEITASDPANGDVKSWTRASTEDGRKAKSITIELPRGATKTVSYTSTLPDGDRGPVSVRYTPTVRETPVNVDASCGAAVVG